MFRALRRLLIGSCVALALLTLAAPPALAAPDKKELSRARKQFQQATELEQAGQYAAAIDLFREVGQVRMTPHVRYHIAFCEEKLGRLAAALGGYQLAASEAQEVGPAFEKEVQQRIEDLKSRIPKLVIQRGEGAKAARIELDGVQLGASSIGVEIPVDPGPHSVSAKAPGREPFSTTVELAEKELKPVEVTLAEADAAGAAPAGAGITTGSSDSGVGPDGKPPSKLAPIVLISVGAASLAASGVFFYLRQNKLSELDDTCGSDRKCPPEAQDTHDQVKTYNTLAMVTAGVGIVAVGVGVTWLVLQKPPAKAKTGWQLAPAAPGAHAGLSALRRF